MATTAKRAEFLVQLKALEDDKKRPLDQKKLRPRDRIRIRMRCRLCGRARAVYRKFGVCRICFRDLASNGLIPGVKKATGERTTAMMTDPIADMLTRLRNGSRIERPVVDMPATKLKARVAQVLKDEGYIVDYQLGTLGKDAAGHEEFKADPKSNLAEPHVILRVFMKYGPDGERLFMAIDRASKPGRRLYRRANQLKPVLDGLGIAILSTSKGVMSDRQARAQRVGGELLCTVW